MINVDGWERVESDDKAVFAKFVNSEATLYIRQGKEWPEEIDVVLDDGDEQQTIAQRELMPEAIHAAESFMDSVM